MQRFGTSVPKVSHSKLGTRVWGVRCPIHIFQIWSHIAIGKNGGHVDNSRSAGLCNQMHRFGTRVPKVSLWLSHSKLGTRVWTVGCGIHIFLIWHHSAVGKHGCHVDNPTFYGLCICNQMQRFGTSVPKVSHSKLGTSVWGVRCPILIFRILTYYWQKWVSCT